MRPAAARRSASLDRDRAAVLVARPSPETGKADWILRRFARLAGLARISLIRDRKTRAEISVANGIHRISRCDARRGNQIRRSTAAQCKEDRGYNASPCKPNQTPPMQSIHNILPAVAPHCHIYGERLRTSESEARNAPTSGEPIVLSFTTVGILRTLCGQHSNLCGKPTTILGKSSLFQCEIQFMQPEEANHDIIQAS